MRRLALSCSLLVAAGAQGAGALGEPELKDLRDRIEESRERVGGFEGAT